MYLAVNLRQSGARWGAHRSSCFLEERRNAVGDADRIPTVGCGHFVGLCLPSCVLLNVTRGRGSRACAGEEKTKVILKTTRGLPAIVACDQGKALLTPRMEIDVPEAPAPQADVPDSVPPPPSCPSPEVDVPSAS
ncbi:hypothetical protein AAFF_G00153280 [Aldrovandia affinis]|uniref:Uncharacterized protein n=1 Tax=Aldrovandia affinis TaxID=143900 RepID=A0AAD7WWK7_9TELE|nr:hypothetical protein AAFF_G00153280 [Aldrovandia affinis]